MSSRTKKERVIILPNKDKLRTGKLKDENKILNMVSAEYDIAEDIGYFVVVKEKSDIQLKLQFIPRAVSQLHTNDAKKFVVYELARIGYGCVMRIDDGLNKKAQLIIDLLNSIDDKCKEAITLKLHAIFDTPEELDYQLDQLLTDPQFNSFKFTILNEFKTSCLLCVNGDGLFVRSLESPFDVIKQLLWQDIATIKRKTTKLMIRKKNGETEEIPCINKKTVTAAHSHLVKYLMFINNNGPAMNKPIKGSWFGSVALRIRQSFTRRARPINTDRQTSAHSPTSKSTDTHYRENAPPNSTVPGSSIVSEDCMDNIGSLKEPSIKTNSTHDVSLGSANSFRPGTSSVVRMSGQDDYMSVKTNSTYEVSLDTSSATRTLSSTIRSDFDSSGQSQSKKSPLLATLEDNAVFGETSENRESETMFQFAPIKESHSPPTQNDDSPPYNSQTRMAGPSDAISSVDNTDAHRARERNTGTTTHSSEMISLTECNSQMVTAGSHTQPLSSTNDSDAAQRDTHVINDAILGDNTSQTHLPTQPSQVNDSQNSIPSQKMNKPSRISSSSSCKEPPSPTTPSPSDKENYNISTDTHTPNNVNGDDTHINFSRFGNEEYVVDSKTTFTSVCVVGDSITKKLTTTELSSVKATGVPTPKQYKTTTIITSKVKKPSDTTKSPEIGGVKTSGIPRMSSN